MVPPVGTRAYHAYRRGEHRKAVAALRPSLQHRDSTVLALWRSGLFNTVEIAARTGLKEEDVDRIISAEMNGRHADREARR